MASNTLNNRSSGETILATFWNDIHQALNGDLVGRNSSGVPTSGQNLGTAAIPWGTLRCGGIIVGGSSVDVSQVFAPTHRVLSGASRSTSNQPAYMVPAGSGNGASATLDGTPTSLVYAVAGTSYTLSADLALSSLTTAPSTNNTCLVNDTDAADQDSTRTWGEPDAEKTSITIDTAGSEITGKVGQYAAFSINNGSETEYFTAFIKSSTELTDCRRGFFYDESLAPINRIVFSNNDTITLMSLGYVFLDINGTTTDVTYTEPQYQDSAPSAPATGDYWFDIPNSIWKRYDGASFVTVDRTQVGWVCLDDTDCVAARSVDFDARYKRDIMMDLELSTVEIARAREQDSMVNVAGQEINFRNDRPQWNITTDLANSADLYDATEQASTFYFLYISDEGETILSDIEPYRRNDLSGWYHPHNPWRMVGSAFNDSGSDFQFATPDLEEKKIQVEYEANSSQSVSTSSTTVVDFEDVVDDRYGLGTVGASWNIVIPAPGRYMVKTCISSVSDVDWNAAGESTTADLYVNATQNKRFDYQELQANPGSAHSFHLQGSVSRRLNRGDVVDIRYTQTSGGSVTIGSNELSTFMSLVRVKD